MNNFSKYILDESYKSIYDEIVRLLNEGGAAKHMAHPFDIVKNGKELIRVFADSIKSLDAGNGAVKIDGINASIRLVNGRFVMDRGSAKPLDIRGIRPDDLEDRFGSGHGMIEVGKKVLQIFDKSLTSTKSELKSLGLLDNPNIMLNVEYVEGQSNVLEYDTKNFLAIHGLLEIFVSTTDKSGNPKSRGTREIHYNEESMNAYIEKVNIVADKYGFNVLGSVAPKFKNAPNLTRPLSDEVTIKFSSGPETKPLLSWLKSANVPKPMITRDEFQKILSSKNVDVDFDKSVLQDKIDGAIIWLATIKLGDEILKNLTSDVGDLEKHEGVVIRDSKINSSPFKITGSFILRGMSSQFQKK